MAKVQMYLVHESDNARLFRRTTQAPDKPDIWIPKSVTLAVELWPEVKGRLRLCNLEIEEWFAEMKRL